VCRSWEAAQPGSHPKLANGNIPYHGRQVQFMNGGDRGARTFSFFLSHFHECESSLVGEFELFREFGVFFGNFAKVVSLGFRDRCLGSGCEMVIRW